MKYLVYLVFLLSCAADRSLRVDIFPGFGWDHLRFLELAPVYDVSNFNTSDAFQACIEMIPLHENKIEMGSVEVDTFDSQNKDYSSNLMIGGSAGYMGFRISGSYSKEYQSMKKTQAEEKTISLRNEIDYLMVDVMLQPSCPLHAQVKKDLMDIAKHQASNQSLLATYFAQLFVKKYGTHFTSRLYLGGSIVEEDFISHSSYSSSQTEKNRYKAAAEASFLGSFSVSASFSSGSEHNTATINEYKQKIHRKVVSSRGGDVFILGSHMEAWQASVKKNPAIIRRAMENITFFITADKLPELTDMAVHEIRKEIDAAVNSYVEMNTIRGCMDRNSPSFSWIANVNDGACAPVTQTTQFGGFIRTCSEDSEMPLRCSGLRINNYYTSTEQCQTGFTRYLLHSTIKYESVYRSKCHKCGFLWLKQCCESEFVRQGQRHLSIYGCNRNVSQQLSSFDPVTVKTTYVFGGSYTAQKVNPVTNSDTCPQGLSPVIDLDGIKVCLAARITTGADALPRYGGIYSCQYGNIATRSRDKSCPDGFSAYAMGAIDGNCFLEVCLKFEQTSARQALPAVALPPFFSIDTIYPTLTNNATEGNDTVSARVVHDRQ